MKPDDAIESITRFFNDLIGAIVPGSILTLGLVILHLGPDARELITILDGAIVSLSVVGLFFAIGHVLLAFHEHVLLPALCFLRVSSKFDEKRAERRASFKLFQRAVQANRKMALGEKDGEWGFHDLRSVALTISTSAERLGKRFMFISLLCNGTGTALTLIAADFAFCRVWAPDLMHAYANAPNWLLQILLLLSAATFLFKRAQSFHDRAMTTPFAAAIADLAFERKEGMKRDE